MIKLYDNGVYLLNGAEIVEDTGNVQVPLSKEEANLTNLHLMTLHSWELFRRQELQALRSSRCPMC